MFNVLKSILSQVFSLNSSVDILIFLALAILIVIVINSLRR